MDARQWLPAAFLLLTLLVMTASSPGYFIAAPNVFRIGVEETVGVHIYGTSGVLVRIYLQDYPARTKIFSEVEVTCSEYQPVTVKLKINYDDVELKDASSGSAQYVYLVAKSISPHFTFNKVLPVLITHKTQHLFLQVDKPIYTPDQAVKIRAFPVNEDLEPIAGTVRLDLVNPQGVTVDRHEIATRDNGYISRTFTFPTFPVFGNWTLIGYFGRQFKFNETVKFEVKQYVLPTFSVEVGAPEYILPQDTHISGNVTARYVYGKPVDGSVYIKLGVIDSEGEQTDFVSIGEMLTNGMYEFIIPTRTVQEHGSISWFPTGSRLVIDVQVTEKASGITESKKLMVTPFIETPYRLLFKNTVRNFLPGFPYQFQIDLLYPQKSPAANVAIRMEASALTTDGTDMELIQHTGFTDEHGEFTADVDIPAQKNIHSITINIKTVDPHLLPDQQAKRSIEILPYKSPSMHYLWLEKPESSLRIGQLQKITMRVGGNIRASQVSSKAIFLVVSRGKIVHQGIVSIATVTHLMFLVTPEMVPSCRIVAFYQVGSEVVANSLLLDVENRCQHEITIKTDEEQYKPGEDGTVSLSGWPRSTVGVLAVDSAVYLLSNHKKLSRDKVFQTLEKDDLGCSPGGGVSSKDVFKDAGLAVLTSADLSGELRSELGCHERHNRVKRALTEKANDFAVASTIRKCCKDGQQLDMRGRTCLERAEDKKANLNSDECYVSFLNCCTHAFEQREIPITEPEQVVHASAVMSGLIGSIDASEPHHIPERLPFRALQGNQKATSSDPESEIHSSFTRGRAAKVHDIEMVLEDDLERGHEEEDGHIRSYFPETWLFEDITLPASGRYDIKSKLPGSITTWIVQAVAVSHSIPICVSKPKPITAFKKLFLDLNVPYAAVRHEQFEIRATVFNYDDHDHDIQAMMQGVDGLCSGALPGYNSSAKRFTVYAHDSGTVSFLVVPLKVGKFPIRVLATADDGAVDIIEKPLRVEPEGVEKVSTYSAVLDPSGQLKKRFKRDVISSRSRSRRRRSEQTNTVDVTVPEDAIPDTDRCSVTVMGDLLGATVRTVLGGMDPLLSIPTGCGEQTMIHMAPAVYSMYYLKRTGQLTEEMAENGKKFIIDGYNQEMAFRKEDGSFSVWPHLDSSTWLSAFVMKAFCQAEEFIYVDSKVTCVAMKWLLQQQKATGGFNENYRVWHKEMMGGLHGEVSLTAFVLISMLSCKNCEIPEMASSVARAVGYLEHELLYLNEPYAIAIVAYALSLSGSPKRVEAVHKLNQLSVEDTENNLKYWPINPNSLDTYNNVHWYQHNATAVEIETTAYALLALLYNGDLSSGNPIVEWLIQQRNANGGFLSTQDTVVALQALADYSSKAKIDELELLCEIRSETNQTFRKNVLVHKNNAFVQQQHTVPTGGELIINTKGRGVGQLQVELHYHIPSVETQYCTYDLQVHTREYRAESRRDPSSGSNKRRRQKFSSSSARISTKLRGRTSRISSESRSRTGRELSRSRFDYDILTASEQTQSVYDLEIKTCVRYLKENAAGMTILEIGIFTGFSPIVEDLQVLVNEVSEYVQHFELSSRAVIVYLERVPSDAPYCIKFRARREFVVGTIQAAPVKVFSYYEPEDMCTVFYRPEAGSPLLETICVGSECVCAEENCGRCYQLGRRGHRPLSYEELWERTCHESEYAYRILVKKIQVKNSIMKITATVRSAIREGKDKIGRRKKRIFLQLSSCYCPKLKEGVDYFISGRQMFRYKNADGSKTYKYFLDHDTYVERWYRKRELRRLGDDPKAAYKKLRKLENRIRKKNCKKK